MARVRFRTKSGKVVSFSAIPGKKRKGKKARRRRRGLGALAGGKVDYCDCKKMKNGAYLCKTTAARMQIVSSKDVKAHKASCKRGRR